MAIHISQDYDMNITPCLMVKNEEYWIHYVLRDLLKVFPEVIVLDTGSTDNTLKIIYETAQQSSKGKVTLLTEHFITAEEFGMGRNILRQVCPTDWMFLVDGDEIWREQQLHNLLDIIIPRGTSVVMVAGWNVEDVDGHLMLRQSELSERDGLFSKKIEWTRLDYPFESYGLHSTLPEDEVLYTDKTKIYAWHMRHTVRSSKEADVFFREQKLDYYSYQGPYLSLPTNWLGEIAEFDNPYLERGDW